MTRHDDPTSLGNGVVVQLGQVVNHVYGGRTDLDQVSLRNGRRPGARVVIAAHGFHGSDLRELLENTPVSDIAGMYDQVTASERIKRLRTQQSVGVGDQSYPVDIARGLELPTTPGQHLSR